MTARRRVRALVWLVATVLGCSVGVVPASADDPAPPAVPTDVTAIRLTRYSMEISFNPGVGGGPVTNFWGICETVRDSGSAYFTATSSPVVLYTRTPGRTWTCKLVAAGVGGQSAYSTPSAPVTLWSRPAVNLYMLESLYSSETEAQVAFSVYQPYYWALADEYRVECSSTDGGVTRARVVTASPLTMSRLTPGAVYHCRVRADNQYGVSQWSAYRDVVHKPNPPVGISARRVATDAIEVSFSPPAGPTPTSYQAACRRPTGFGWSKSGTASPIVVTGLPIRTSFTCSVYARVGSTSSDKSADSEPVPLLSAPAAPTSVSAQVDGPSQVTVSFVPGTWHTGSEFDQVALFVAQCRSSDGGTARARGRVSSPISVVNLDPGRTYRCRARGVNDQGKGAWSAYTNAFVLPTDLSG